MPYYKDTAGRIYWLDDEKFEHLIPADCILISDAEADSMRKPTASAVWESIKAERDRRKSGGVAVGEKWFHSDDASRIQQIALVMMGEALPADLQWKTMDGSFITMTPSVAKQVFTAQAASDQAIFSIAESHKAAMEASADPAAYNYLTGWPTIFGE